MYFVFFIIIAYNLRIFTQKKNNSIASKIFSKKSTTMKKTYSILFLLISFVYSSFAQGQVVQAVSVSPKDSTGGFANTQQQYVF